MSVRESPNEKNTPRSKFLSTFLWTLPFSVTAWLLWRFGAFDGAVVAARKVLAWAGNAVSGVWADAGVWSLVIVSANGKEARVSLSQRV